MDLRYGQRRTAPGGFIRGKTFSAISGDPDIPYFLLLDDPVNELLLPVGLGADRILTSYWWILNAGYGQLGSQEAARRLFPNLLARRIS